MEREAGVGGKERNKAIWGEGGGLQERSTERGCLGSWRGREGQQGRKEEEEEQHIFYQGCSLTNDMKKREDSLHAS